MLFSSKIVRIFPNGENNPTQPAIKVAGCVEVTIDENKGDSQLSIV